MKLETWDVVEKDPSYLLPKLYLKDACVNIACCDTTDPNAFDHAKDWIGQLERYSFTDVPTVVAYTKSDLASPENIAGIRERSGSLGAPFVMCSTKTGAGMDELLEKVLEMTEAKKNLDFGMVEKEPQKAEKLKFKFGKRN